MCVCVFVGFGGGGGVVVVCVVCCVCPAERVCVFMHIVCVTCGCVVCGVTCATCGAVSGFEMDRYSFFLMYMFTVEHSSICDGFLHEYGQFHLQ